MERNASRRLARAVITIAAGALLAASAVPANAAAPEDGCHPEARKLFVTYQPVEHSADATSVRARLRD